MVRIILTICFTSWFCFAILQAFPFEEEANEKPLQSRTSLGEPYQTMRGFVARDDAEPPVEDEVIQEEPVPVEGEGRVLAISARDDVEPPDEEEEIEEPVPVEEETEEKQGRTELDDEELVGHVARGDGGDENEEEEEEEEEKREEETLESLRNMLEKMRKLSPELRNNNQNSRALDELDDLQLDTRRRKVSVYGVNIDYLASSHPAKKLRSGQASDTFQCNRIGPVPANLRDKSVMWPKGIQAFYTKYTHAYGVPIIGSSDVTDEGLRRACYEVAFLLGPHYGIRNAMYKLYVRVALIGDNEEQTTLPEYSKMDKKWDKRARGLGGTIGNPTTSVGDDNMRCAAQNGGTDRYWNQDILAHEFGHTMHLLGGVFAIEGFARRIGDVYRNALAAEKWKGSYAGSKVTEYYATGMQFFMNASTGFKVKSVQDRVSLNAYDPDLYDLLEETYSCENTKWIERCQYKGRRIPPILKLCSKGPDGSARCTSVPANQRKQCGPAGGSQDRCQRRGCCYDTGSKKCYYPANECKDANIECAAMAQKGQCDTNQPYMYVKCPFSCGTCAESQQAKSKFSSSELGKMCQNKKSSCHAWAKSNMCTNRSYKSYMASNCMMSCTGCTAPKYPFDV